MNLAAHTDWSIKQIGQEGSVKAKLTGKKKINRKLNVTCVISLENIASGMVLEIACFPH